MRVNHGYVMLVGAWLTLAMAPASQSDFAQRLAYAHKLAAAGQSTAAEHETLLNTLNTMIDHLGEATPEQLSDFSDLLSTVVTAQDQARRTIPPPPAASPMPPSGNDQPGAPSVSALIAKADQQIALGRVYWPLNDSAIGSLGRVLPRLPDASAAEASSFRDLPNRFEARAKAAEQAGHQRQAWDYRHFAAVIRDYLAHSVSHADAAVPPAPAPPGLEAPQIATAQPEQPSFHRSDPASMPQPPRVALQRPDGGNPKHIKQQKLDRALTQVTDPRCRAIVQRMQLGEEPTDVDRAYLRNGCRAS